MPRSNRPTVHKFGGASLANGPAVCRAIDLVRDGPRPAVVVVSALAGATDELLAIGQGLDPRGRHDSGPSARRLELRYRSAARAAVAGRSRARLLDEIAASFAELTALEGAPRFARVLSPAALDEVLARGERLSGRIFAAALASRGLRSEYVDAVRLIVTDGKAGGAFPEIAPTVRRMRAVLGPLLESGIVPVVPGFIGAGPEGGVVTLGRGGSDMTAILAGRALRAGAVMLWKDVPGFLTADPRVVADARVVPQLNVREAAELAYYGAKVLQPRALIPIIGTRVPVFIRPFGQPDGAGTEISGRRTLGRYPVKALSAMASQALVTVTGSGMLGVPGIAARTFGALQRGGISVSLISQASSEHSICFSVPDADADMARDGLLDEFAAEIRKREIDGVEITRGVATISVVGLGMAGTPGIAARVFAPLARAGINIIAIAQGSSELNISFAVSGKDAGEAQKRVHEAFRLAKIGGGAASEPEHTDVVLLGFGQVARTLATLVARRRTLRLVAVADTSGFLFRPEGFSPRAAARIAAAKKERLPVAKLPGGRTAPASAALDFIAGHALARPVLVDATAGDTAGILEHAVACGFDLVLANKRPLSGPREQALSLQQAIAASGRRLRFEATVGAGLPVLDTYHKLVESGDRVQRIEGCLSGTLGFLLSELENGRPFSRAVREAVELGYAEPDPREDLSGRDVARKALILGRLLGFEGEPRDVAVESLAPASSRRASRPRFLARLERSDGQWQRRMAAARSKGGVLRYIASVTRRRITVGLRLVRPDSAFGSLRGTDNQVAFTTLRYRRNPLVIRGPGAGLAVTAAGIFNDISLLAGG